MILVPGGGFGYLLSKIPTILSFCGPGMVRVVGAITLDTRGRDGGGLGRRRSLLGGRKREFGRDFVQIGRISWGKLISYIILSNASSALILLST